MRWLAGAAMCVTRPTSSPSCFEIRPLLDVQLDKLMKAAVGHGDGFERPGESGLRAPLLQAAAFLVAQGERLLRT